jgi:8-oxo-dGTP pyrophosphatase MutT (NUDIX family)
MMPGETPEATVVREVQEETGVQVKIIELLGWYERTGFRAHLSPPERGTAGTGCRYRAGALLSPVPAAARAMPLVS